jgi:hypothetical protein
MPARPADMDFAKIRDLIGEHLARRTHMTNAALRGATYDIDGGQQFVA